LMGLGASRHVAGSRRSINRRSSPDDERSSSRHLCVTLTRRLTFPPGASYTYVLKVPIRDVLADSLPNARYEVTVSLAINSTLVRDLNAGEVELSVPHI
jgi:hypothetical protein